MRAARATSPDRGPIRGRVRILGPTALWLFCVTLGFAALDGHDRTPGATAPAPGRWPADCGLAPRTAGLPTLVLFAHPLCPCTRATVGELEVLMAREAGRVDARVVFVRPPGVEPRWERTALWDRVARIPGVVVSADEGGVEASRFGAKTSGQVLLYDPDGVLRFSGGITASRGHAGDNAGRAAVEGLLSGRTDVPASTPVYGCPLLAPPCDPKGATCVR